jgi:quinoprotein glucose dehydrogenase
MRIWFVLALAAAMMLPAVNARSGKAKLKPDDWPSFTRDLGGTRFSPLKQINTGNVSKLAAAWSFRLRPEGGGMIVSGTTPIVVDGVLYLPIGNAVVALEGIPGRKSGAFPSRAD